MLDSLNSKTIEFRLCRYISIPKLSFFGFARMTRKWMKTKTIVFFKRFFSRLSKLPDVSLISPKAVSLRLMNFAALENMEL